MTRQERTELDKALLEAARRISEHSLKEPIPLEDVYQILKSKIPSCFKPDEGHKSDWDAWYEAKERWIAEGEYAHTGKNCNIFHEGWRAARDHYKDRNLGDRQK